MSHLFIIPHPRPIRPNSPEHVKIGHWLSPVGDDFILRQSSYRGGKHPKVVRACEHQEERLWLFLTLLWGEDRFLKYHPLSPSSSPLTTILLVSGNWFVGRRGSCRGSLEPVSASVAVLAPRRAFPDSGASCSCFAMNDAMKEEFGIHRALLLRTRGGLEGVTFSQIGGILSIVEK